MTDIEKDVNLEAAEEEMEESFVTLIDEDGNEEEFEILEMLEVDGKEYAIIAPLEGEEDDDEALIFRLEYDEKSGEDLLVDLDDDEEWDKVAEVYMGMEDEEE